MIEKLKKKALINEIDPYQLAAYLENKGWHLLKTKKNYVRIFQHFINGRLDKQVNIPLDKELGDYSESLRDSLYTVAGVEKISYEDLLNSLLYYTSDTIKIRLNRPSVSPGSIMMQDAISIFNNLKKLLEATAMDISCPRGIHRGRTTNLVQGFIDNCRFGQTEIGSYIVTVICPLSKDDISDGNQANILTDEELYNSSMARQVTDRMMHNINMLKDNLDNVIDVDSNMRMLDYPISSNFVDALSGLSLKNEDAELEFIVNWAPITKKKANYKNRVSFSHVYYDRLRDLSNRIKAIRATHIDICGKIIKLESELDEKVVPYGRATVLCMGENRNKRKLTVSLNRKDYDLAVGAHFNGSLVHVVADKLEDNSIDLHCFEVEGKLD